MLTEERSVCKGCCETPSKVVREDCPCAVSTQCLVGALGNGKPKLPSAANFPAGIWHGMAYHSEQACQIIASNQYNSVSLVIKQGWTYLYVLMFVSSTTVRNSHLKLRI